MDWIDTIWDCTFWLLIAVMGTLFVWATLSDRVRRWRASRRSESTRRCPRCWYDMHGVSGRRCPECGKSAASEKRLARSRIRWRGVAAALTLLAPAWVAAKMPEVRVGGWGRLVPTAALALMLNDPHRWIIEMPDHWTARELVARDARHMPGWVGERVLAWRLARCWSDKPWRHELGWDVAVLDTSVITRNEFSAVPAASAITRWQRSLRIGVGRSVEIQVSQNTQSLRDALAWGTGWGSYGEYGDGGRMVDIGDRLVVACSKERLDRIRKLLEVIASPAARTDTAELEEVTIIGARLTQTKAWMSPSQVASRAEALAGLLREVVAVSRPSAESSTWIFSFDGRILIRGSADTRRRCVEALQSVLSVAENGDRVETGGLSILRLDKLPSAQLVDGEWRVSYEELIELRDAIVQSIDADGWADSNGSADCIILPIGATMVIGGDAERRIRSIQLMDALLSTLRDGLARSLPVGRRTSESTTKPEHIAMWPIGQHLRVWRGSTKNEHEAGQAMLEDLQSSSPELDDALNVRLSLFHHVLILSTTEPELIDHVEAALVQKALDTSP